MWYVLRLGVADSIRRPVITDACTIQGPSLEWCLMQALHQLLDADDASRKVAGSVIQGLLHAGIEVQTWDSLSSYEQRVEADEDSLLAMRQSVMDAFSSGSSSPWTGTPMRNSDSSPN